MSSRIRVGVLGASGYTGADFVRLAARHPQLDLVLLTANSHAGKAYGDVFPHLSTLDLPTLRTIEKADWGSVDAIVCGLPHGTTQAITKRLFADYPDVKIIDMSADFRLRDPAVYSEWYGIEHGAPEIQPDAVYGLTEHYRHAIRKARLVACPGCYPTATLLGLLPLAKAGLIDPGDIVIDAKSGVSGAGRGLRENTLFCEAGEGLSPYSVGKHRHMAEIEQELGLAAGVTDLRVNFTPHLIPMSRGELCTCYVRLADGADASALREALQAAYADKAFVHVAAEGVLPRTQMVRGSNHAVIGVVADRIPGRAIVIATLDNLVKGSAGQAMQNLNLAFGIEESTALEQLPLFP